MNSLERVLTVIDGGIPDRVPVAMHNFLAVGQFIGCDDLSVLLKDGEVMAQAQIAAWHELGHDLLQLELGVASLAQALGAEARYSPTEPPHVLAPILKSLKDAENLKLPNPEKDWPLSANIEATRIVCREIGDSAFICGRADQGPMALAAAIRGVENLIYDIMDAQDDPDIERQLLFLLDFCTKCCTDFGIAQGRAGAHGTCIGGYGISTISPKVYRKYEQPFEKRFAESIKASGIYSFLHICGDEIEIMPDMIDTGAQVLEMDPLSEMSKAKSIAGGKVTLLGFVDPANVIGCGTPALIREKCREAIEFFAPGGRFILSPGCALPVETPAENMRAVVESALAMSYSPDGTIVMA